MLKTLKLKAKVMRGEAHVCRVDLDHGRVAYVRTDDFLAPTDALTAY